MKSNGKHDLGAFDMARLAANIAESKKAVETLMLETGQVSYLADYFVICSGESGTQIRTIADEIEKRFKQRGLTPIGKEKDKNNKWSLLDYGDVVIHVMNRQEREYYQLEHFWSHANVVAAEDWLAEETQRQIAS